MMKIMNNRMRSVGMVIAILVVIILGALYGTDIFERKIPTGEESITDTSEMAVYTNENGDAWKIERGRNEFAVSSAEEYPKFVSGVIDPLDVHPGDVQTMEVVVRSDVPLVRVWAEIETDNDVEIVDLELMGSEAVTRSNVENQPYLINENGRLIMNRTSSQWTAVVAAIVNLAQAQGVVEYVYAGAWTVYDTHVRTYHTIFYAEDEYGRVDDLTLMWSDPCSWSGGNLTANCTLSAIDGLDAQSMNLNGLDITLNSGGYLAFNGGSYGITIPTNSSIAFNGGVVGQAYLFYTDSDGDGYAPNSTMSTSSQTTVSGKVRTSSASGTNDCYDSNNKVYPGQTAWYANMYAIIDVGWSWDYNCSGPAEQQYTLTNGGCIDCEGVDDFTCTLGVGGGVGWSGSSAPICGASGTYYTNKGSCPPEPACFPIGCSSESRTQRCH